MRKTHHPPVGRRRSRKEFLRAAAAGVALAGCAGLGVACLSPDPLSLSVEPRRVRGDEPFVARLTGLSPGERASLSAYFTDALVQEWSSTAIFEADREGTVDTSRQAPVGGSYGVSDPMGLVWSALGADFYAPPEGAYSLTLAARAGEREASAEVERYAMAEGVEAINVREEGLVGRLFLPGSAGGDLTPGVLVLGGSEGGLSPHVTYEGALLASRGFAALAVAYFRGESFEPEGAGGLPETLTRVPLEYFGRALRWLGGHEAVAPDRLGVVGHSRGGELALLLGANYPELKAVVSYVGSGAVLSSPEGEEPAWTLRGEAVPYVPYTEDPSSVTREQEREAEIAVERINGPVLLVAGGDDVLWPSERFSRIAYDRLRRHDRDHEDELAVYPEAGHLIVAPYVPTAPGRIQLGGNARANARACEDSWEKALSLLGGRLKA